MVATREKWETTLTLPRGATSYEQMLEFFGIPLSTIEALDDISKKRRRLESHEQQREPAGLIKAAEILKSIQRIRKGCQARHGRRPGRRRRDRDPGLGLRDARGTAAHPFRVRLRRRVRRGRRLPARPSASR